MIEKVIENLIEFLRNRGGLTIAAGKRKSPKSLENQGFWAMVPVTGLECTMEHPAETPGGNSPPDCCIYMGSSPAAFSAPKKRAPEGALFFGAANRTRTGTLSPAVDFESRG